MRTRITATLVVAAIIAIATLLGTSSAQAQPCAVINVSNFTACEIGLCLYDAAGNRVCITLGPFGSPTSTGFIGGFVPVGAVSAAKNQYPFAGNPFCTPCIRIPGSTTTVGCCATVCYDVAGCNITVNPCFALCLP